MALPTSYTMMQNLVYRCSFPTNGARKSIELGSKATELLTLLVERYEQEHYSVPKADPVSIVRFLIERQNLTQRDLVPQFGSESAVSKFMTGQRNLTLEKVRKLSSRFKLSRGTLHFQGVRHAQPKSTRKTGLTFSIVFAPDRPLRSKQKWASDGHSFFVQSTQIPAA